MSVPTAITVPAPSRPAGRVGSVDSSGPQGRNDSTAGDFAVALDSATSAHERSGRLPGDGPAGPTGQSTDPAAPELVAEAVAPVGQLPDVPVPAAVPVAPGTAPAPPAPDVTTPSGDAAPTGLPVVVGPVATQQVPTPEEAPAATATVATAPVAAVTPATGPATPAQAASTDAQAGGQDPGTDRGATPTPDDLVPVPAAVPNENDVPATVVGHAGAPVTTVQASRPDASVVAAATTAPVDGTTQTGAPTAVRTLDTGPVAAPAQPSRPPVVPDLASQLAPRVGSLRSLGEGVHRLVMRVQPEHIGAVRVVAEITGDSVRIELHGGTEQAREALRAVLPELRRDLQGGDLPGQRAELDLGSAGRHGNRQGPGDQTGANRSPVVPGGLDPSAPVELVLSRVPSGRLDVLT